MSTATLKDAELEHYYQHQFEMYGSQGWHGLMEDLAYMLDAAQRLDGIETAEQLHFRKGEISILRMMVGYRESREQAYAAKLAEEQGVDEEAGTGGVGRVIE